jgi:peptidoglycan/xylan/chitin deacetylase (PgdA/CDA1 family)
MHHKHQVKIKINFSAMVLGFSALVVLFSFLLENRVEIERHKADLYLTYRNYLDQVQHAEEEFVPNYTNASSPKIASSVPVLVYHGIVEKPDRFSLTADTFFNQMLALKKAGYKTVSLSEFQNFLNGQQNLPEKSFVLTFDDGRKDSFLGADPILRALDFKAVMFIATGQSLTHVAEKGHYFLSTSEIKEMLKTGRWDIQSHAVQPMGGFIPVDANGKVGNFLSNKMYLEGPNRLETDDEYIQRVQDEISGSKSTIEKKLSTKVFALSYPFSDYGQQTINNESASSVIGELIKKNYSLAFRQVWDGISIQNRPGDDLAYLKRIETPTDWSGGQLLAFINMGKDKTLPYTDLIEKDNGWRGEWGVHAVTNGELVLKATSKTTGSDVFLDGSQDWSDYQYTVNYDWIKGSRFSLVARQKDDKNYLACVFGGGSIRLDRYVNDVPKMIGETAPLRVAALDGSVGMRVRGNIAECIVENRVVVSASIPAERGGIGAKIWDPEFANAEIHIKEVSIEPLTR